MNEKTVRSISLFLVRVLVIHTLTYIIAGLLAANSLDYRQTFTQPVIRDYMLAFGSASSFWGPIAQLLRGLVIGFTLLPFRQFLATTKRGWLYLWLLFVGIGIIATPAAAPSSIEGVIYTQLPLWYHLFGLPEMLIQTLAFSVVVHRYMRYPAGILESLPRGFSVIVQAFAGACFAFIGYAVVSILFALGSGAAITAETNLSLRTQGLFIVPFILNFAVIVVWNLTTSTHRLGRIAIFILVLLSNAAAILLYQGLILNGVNMVYAFVAPVGPAAIIAVMTSARKDGTGVVNVSVGTASAWPKRGRTINDEGHRDQERPGRSPGL